MLAALLISFLIAAPLFRLTHFAWITHTHTVTHIDGIAMGSLLALGLYTLPLTRRTWLTLGLIAMPVGLTAAGTIAGGTAFLDTALTTLFAGAVLSSIASTGYHTPFSAILSRGALAWYGKISYGLYMSHIATFVYFGWVDARLNSYGIPGNLAVVAFRLIACTLVASLLWYGFESRILRLKRYFKSPVKEQQKQQSYSL
jgi:peptidoglycan/LPS O-acetylase OafA/YrhL